MPIWYCVLVLMPLMPFGGRSAAAQLPAHRTGSQSGGEMTLADALVDLGRRTGVRIMFGAGVERSTARVRPGPEGEPLAAALRRLLEGRGLAALTQPSGAILVVATGRIVGTIGESGGRPLPGAVAQVLGHPNRVTAGPDGRFEIADAPPGRQRLRVDHPGYRTWNRELTVPEGGTVSVTIGLELASTELPELSVQGRQGYTGARSTTGTRTDGSVLEVPQSVQIITRAVIDDQRPARVVDALRNVSNVVPETGNSGTMDGFYIRGFTVFSPHKNGFRRDRVGGLADLSNVDRIEVLKGPSSVLYGQGSLGGLVNIVTKQAAAVSSGSFEAQGGSFGTARLEGDVTGPIDAAARLRYRVSGSVARFDSYRDAIEGDRVFVAPVIAWHPTGRTVLEFSGEYLRQDQPFLGSSGILGSNNQIVSLPIETNAGHTANKRTADESILGFRLEHDFGAGWHLRASGQYLGSKEDYFAAYFAGLQSDGVTVDRGTYGGTSDSWQGFGNLEILGKVRTGPIGHELLAGVELGRSGYDSEVGFGDGTPFDLRAPALDRSPSMFADLFPYDDQTRRTGFYVQDRLRLNNRVALLAGIRQDRHRYRYRFEAAGAFSDDERADATSPRLGLVVTPSTGLALFAGYTRSFEPVSGADNLGNPFVPERGTQYEVGAKADLANGRLTGTMSLYRLTRSNVVTRDPNSPAGRVQIGEQQSKGFEADLAAAPIVGLDVIASYGFADATITADRRFPVGARLTNIPRATARLWATGRPVRGPLVGWSLGAGVSRIGRRPGELSLTTYETPGYTIVDAALRLRRHRWQAGLVLQNAFDARYFEATQGGTNLLYGAPRTVQASFGVLF